MVTHLVSFRIRIRVHASTAFEENPSGDYTGDSLEEGNSLSSLAPTAPSEMEPYALLAEEGDISQREMTGRASQPQSKKDRAQNFYVPIKKTSESTETQAKIQSLIKKAKSVGNPAKKQRNQPKSDNNS